MLRNFFRLNSPFQVFRSQLQLTSFLESNDCLDSVLYEPDSLSIPVDTRIRKSPFAKKTFKNVSFGKTTISDITFRKCKFEDCLFIGTRFINCEFHDCTFEGCNPHKVVFKETYIDPVVFERKLDKVKYSNIGMHLFQQLYENAMDMHQYEFARSAEFNRWKWRRYVLDHRYEKLQRLNPKWVIPWVQNILYYIFVGYGIRFKFLGRGCVNKCVNKIRRRPSQSSCS